MAPKGTPDIKNFPAYNNHNSLPGMLYSLKSFKCMFAAPNHQTNDLPKPGISERNEENDQLKKREPEVMTCEYHTEDQ